MDGRAAPGWIGCAKSHKKSTKRPLQVDKMSRILCLVVAIAILAVVEAKTYFKGG